MFFKKVPIVLLLLFFQIMNQSQAEPQHSFNLGYSNPYSSFIDTQLGDVKQPFNLPFQAYPKLLDGGIDADEDHQQVAGGRFLWTIYVTQTRYKGSYLMTSYCTTSTAAISICTHSAGRRKRFSKGFRGLFFEEQEEVQFKINEESNHEITSALHTISEET